MIEKVQTEILLNTDKEILQNTKKEEKNLGKYKILKICRMLQKCEILKGKIGRHQARAIATWHSFSDSLKDLKLFKYVPLLFLKYLSLKVLKLFKYSH